MSAPKLWGRPLGCFWLWPRRGKHSPTLKGDVTLTYDDVRPDLQVQIDRDMLAIVPLEVVQVPARGLFERQLAHVRGGFVIRERTRRFRGANARDDIAREEP